VPEEVGFRIDSSEKMIKVDFEEKSNYISRISEYAPLYIIEDKPNLFKTWTSLTTLKPENCVLGLNSGKELAILSYAMIVEKTPIVIFIGGDLTAFKLLVIDSLLNLVDEIWLVGRFGMYFKMYNEKLDYFCGLHLDDFKKKIIEKIYKNIMDMNIIKSMPKSLQVDLKIAEICIPCDVFYADLSNENEEIEIPDSSTPEFIEFIKNNQIYHNFLSEQETKEFEEIENELCLKEEKERLFKQQQQKEKENQENEDEEYEDKNEEEIILSEKKNASIHEIQNTITSENLVPVTSPDKKEEKIEEKPKDLQKENQYFIDYGVLTRKKLVRSIKNCKKLIWIDCLCPNENENFNETNFEVSKFLCSYQEEKKHIIKKENGEGAHNFNEDKIIFTFGKELEEKLNFFDLIDPSEIKPLSQKEENEETKSQFIENNEKNEENKSQTSGQDNVQQYKRNNMALICDFFAKDSEYACKILSGRYPYGNIISY